MLGDAICWADVCGEDVSSLASEPRRFGCALALGRTRDDGDLVLQLLGVRHVCSFCARPGVSDFAGGLTTGFSPCRRSEVWTTVDGSCACDTEGTRAPQ